MFFRAEMPESGLAPIFRHIDGISVEGRRLAVKTESVKCHC